jgi:hypothetical protein
MEVGCEFPVLALTHYFMFIDLSFRTNFIRGRYVRVTDEKYHSLSCEASIWYSFRPYSASVPEN